MHARHDVACSDELHRHLESDVLQAIKEVQSAMADSDARASECGQYDS